MTDAVKQLCARLEQIEFSLDPQGVATLCLNQPQSMNAFSAQMAQDWQLVFDFCQSQDAVRVVILTAKGAAFCVGADMSGGADTFAEQDEMDFSSCPVQPLWQLNKPVVAAINGHAIGLGFSLAMQADIKVCAEEGKYGLIQARRGVLADGVMHAVLPRLVGLTKALEIVLLGQKMTAGQMLDYGLVNQTCPQAQVLERAQVLASDIAANCAPLVLGMAKQLLWHSASQSLAEMEQLETQALHHSMKQADAMEGGLAFVERRQVNWTSSVSEAWPAFLCNNNK